MNKIEILLNKLCPHGVEFRALGEVCEINQFSQIGANELEILKRPNCIDKIRLLPSSQNYDWWSDENTCKNFICEGEIITLGRARYANLKYHKGKFISSNNNIIQAKKCLNGRFLFHFIARHAEEFYVTTSTYPKFDRQIFEDFQIPIPPLEIQNEIVEILDKFTELEKELEKELDARKKQYEFYRESLLNFANPSKWGGAFELKALGEIGSFTRGNGLQKKDFVDVGVPCIHYGQIHTHYGVFTHETLSFVSEKMAKKFKKAKYGDLIIAGVSEDKEGVCKAVAYLGKNEACVSGDSFVFSHKQNPKFISYFFKTQNFQTQKNKFIVGTKVIRVHSSSLEKIKIPIPPLEIQNEIVEILDKFDALVNDISSGLPAEIKARKAQYEHYREQLLSFKEKA